MKKILAFLLVLSIASTCYGATNFPTSLDSYSTKSSGDTIAEGHINDPQDAIEASEAKMGTGADTPVSGDFFKGTGTGTSGWSAFTASDLPAGSNVQVVNTIVVTSSNGNTASPNDDTIPQNDEGTEFMTLAITPTSATNKLLIQSEFTGSSGGSAEVCMALFQDTTANALNASYAWTSIANAPFNSTILHYMTAGTTSETTFKIRVGDSGGNTITMNGVSSARRFGGVCTSSITITEIAV